MSRATVRAAVTSWFSPPNVTGLNTVDRAERKFTDASLWFANPGDEYGAYAFVHIESEREARRAFAGPSSGYKKISYDVALVVQFRHNGESPVDGQDAGERAMDAYDALIEAIKARARADRTMGGAVFQIGEGDLLNGDDIEVLSDLPSTDDGGMIHIWTAVKFKVIEFTSPA